MASLQFTDEGRLVLGANLVAARKKAGLKQGVAARRAGIQQTRLSEWEKAKQVPELETLLRLAVAYQCQVDDFLGGIYEPYDDIIERRLPPDARQHFEARLNKLRALTMVAMELTASAHGTAAPMPGAQAAARHQGAGKSSPVRARRKPSSK